MRLKKEIEHFLDIVLTSEYNNNSENFIKKWNKESISEFVDEYMG